MPKKPAKKTVKKPKKPSQPKPEFNLSHPDVKHKVEVAFKVKGRTYYRFIHERDIPAGRYKYIYSFIREVDLRMNLDTLKQFVSEFKKVLNGGDKKVIDIGRMWQLILNLETRTSLAFEPAGVEKLASVIYFDDTEELSTYNRKHCDDKIKFWKDNNVIDFFLTKPIGELLGLKGISITFLQTCIQEAQEILKDLTFEAQTPSLENLSENGKSHS
jgi:hypothetical protein